jgi:hypothetical protein
VEDIARAHRAAGNKHRSRRRRCRPEGGGWEGKRAGEGRREGRGERGGAKRRQTPSLFPSRPLLPSQRTQGWKRVANESGARQARGNTDRYVRGPCAFALPTPCSSLRLRTW